MPPRTAREGCQLLLGLGTQTTNTEACLRHVLAMDSRTWHAMATGSVDLPRRQVHAGIWFRLIRTIIDELGATISECRTAARMILRVWKEAGYPLRAGPLRWHPHEDYPLDVQLRTLQATATTICLLESRTLTGQGPDAALFLPYAASTGGQSGQ